jgi:hypothetical protein
MLRCTTRDLLWLMVVAAMGAVLVAERNRLENERAALSQERAELRAKRKELDLQFLRVVDASDELNTKLQAADQSNR